MQMHMFPILYPQHSVHSLIPCYRGFYLFSYRFLYPVSHLYPAAYRYRFGTIVIHLLFSRERWLLIWNFPVSVSRINCHRHVQKTRERSLDHYQSRWKFWKNAKRTVWKSCMSTCLLWSVSIQDLSEVHQFFLEFDASGKIPTGISQWATTSEGSWATCNEVDGEKYGTDYCYLMLVPGKVATQVTM